jgi:tetratricopeptide (TPR) repeat protein
MDNFNEQLEQNKELLNSNPNDFKANFNIGNLYYTYAEEMLTQAEDKITAGDEDGKTLLSTGTKLLENSMTYYEKAFELQPDHKEVIDKLKSVYTKLELDHKIKGINERIRD